MNDIVERLRKGADYAHDTEVMEEAATEIVLLRNGLQFADVHAAKIEGLLLGTIKENERLRAALPAGMEHCKILFEECPVGHGHLRGDNWVKLDCAYCKVLALEAENKRLRDVLKMYACDCVEAEICLGECMHKHARAALTQEKTDD